MKWRKQSAFATFYLAMQNACIIPSSENWISKRDTTPDRENTPSDRLPPAKHKAMQFP